MSMGHSAVFSVIIEEEDDDVNGCFWELSFSDVYMLTPEAEKLQETIPFDIQHYVVFG